MDTEALAKFWGGKVADRRHELGLTQVELAQLCGLTQQTISKIEIGEIRPRDRLKYLIADKLATHVGELFAWPEEAHR